MARWTTRKLVHQYPKLSTNPSPMVRPIHSTPSGLVLACSMPRQEWVMLAGSVCLMPCHPPTFRRPIQTRGKKPATIRKNCRTSL